MKISIENPFIADNRDNNALFIELSSAVKDLFGVSFQSLSPNFFEKAKEAITDRFLGITLEDIKIAFKTQEIEKKAYVSLTRDEFLAPIKSYWDKKTKFAGELASIKQREEQIKKKVYFDGIDRVKAIKMYRHMLLNNLDDWMDLGGSVYLANSIARDIAKYMDQKYKNRALGWAKKHRSQDLKIASMSTNNFLIVPIEIMYYSLYIVRFGAVLKINPDEFNLSESPF